MTEKIPDWIFQEKASSNLEVLLKFYALFQYRKNEQ